MPEVPPDPSSPLNPEPLDLEPPVPERRPTALRAHGDTRTDDWYWLGDRNDPAVLEHLLAENRYAESVLGRLEPLRQTIYTEMVARISETDESVPVRIGPWWYFTRTKEGESYGIHCRRPARPGEEPPDVRTASPDEQVVLDENSLAKGLEYFAVGNLVVSPNHEWVAYAIDTTGGEVFTLSFRSLSAPDRPGGRKGRADEVVTGTYYGLAWANDSATVFYTRVDAAMRPYQLWRHRLGTDPSEDVMVLEEPDERFTLSVGWTKDRALITASVQSSTTSEVWTIPADDPEAEPAVVQRRRPGVEYAVEHHAGAREDEGWLLLLTNEEAPDFSLVATGADRERRGPPHIVIPHRPGTRLEGVEVFARHLAVSERLDGELRLRVMPIDLAGEGEPPWQRLFESSRLVPSPDTPSTTLPGPNPESGSRWLRYEVTSLVSPPTVLDLDMSSGEEVFRKRQPVLGDFDPSRYRTGRTWAKSPDGTLVPISLVYRSDLGPTETGPMVAPPHVRAPCLLYGYGAYEHSVDPAFSSLRLSLLDRGFIFAIAHVRGGGELGRHWYESGKGVTKPHTFSDFVACARHLVDHGFTAPELLVARGASAGGMLMGAIANMAPDLFRAVIAEVPFVDCLTTMLDESLPLTVGEWEEWGDPVTDPEVYFLMKSYSPYDNVGTDDVGTTSSGEPGTHYPTILATAGLNDPRVGYWEPAKWVARLRQADPENTVVLRTELSAGHGGPSGRYDAWKDEALVYAFAVDAVGAGAAGAGGGGPAGTRGR